MTHEYHCDANPADTLTVERVGACLQFQARKPVNLCLRDCAELIDVLRNHIRAIHESLARANKAPATLEEVCRTLLGKRSTRTLEHLSPTALSHATELLEQGSPAYIVEEAVAILSRWGWFRAVGITCEPWEVGRAEWDQVAAAKPWERHKRGQRAVPREVAATPSHDALGES